MLDVSFKLPDDPNQLIKAVAEAIGIAKSLKKPIGVKHRFGEVIVYPDSCGYDIITIYRLQEKTHDAALPDALEHYKEVVNGLRTQIAQMQESLQQAESREAGLRDKLRKGNLLYPERYL